MQPIQWLQHPWRRQNQTQSKLRHAVLIDNMPSSAQDAAPTPTLPRDAIRSQARPMLGSLNPVVTSDESHYSSRTTPATVSFAAAAAAAVDELTLPWWCTSVSTASFATSTTSTFSPLM